LKPLLVQPDYTFFIDRSLGRKHLAQMLSEESEKYELHDDHFSQDTPDVDWLKEVGKRGWVVFTKDKRIRHHQDELNALLQANNAVFVFTGSKVTGPEIAEAYRIALPQIKKILDKTQQRKFIAKVTKSGSVSVYKPKNEVH